MPLVTGLVFRDNMNLLFDPLREQKRKFMRVSSLVLFGAIQEYAQQVGYRTESSDRPDLFKFTPITGSQGHGKDHESIYGVCSVRRGGAAEVAVRPELPLQPDDEVVLEVLIC